MTLGRSVAQATAKRGRELGAASALTTLRKLHPYQPPKVDTTQDEPRAVQIHRKLEDITMEH
jgi:hypothetical protein